MRFLVAAQLHSIALVGTRIGDAGMPNYGPDGTGEPLAVMLCRGNAGSIPAPTTST